MKRKTANRANNENNIFSQKQFSCEGFEGIIACAKIEKAGKRIVIEGREKICIIDDGYCWIEMYPDDKNYAITTIFDNNGKLVEWYVDAILNCSNDNGIVAYDDLYLDIAVKPNGQWRMLDDEELLQARDAGEISQKEVDVAYNALKEFKEQYIDNFDNLKKFTRCVCGEFGYSWLD